MIVSTHVRWKLWLVFNQNGWWLSAYHLCLHYSHPIQLLPLFSSLAALLASYNCCHCSHLCLHYSQHTFVAIVLIFVCTTRSIHLLPLFSSLSALLASYSCCLCSHLCLHYLHHTVVAYVHYLHPSKKWQSVTFIIERIWVENILFVKEVWVFPLHSHTLWTSEYIIKYLSILSISEGYINVELVVLLIVH